MHRAEKWSDRVSMVLGLNPGPFTGPGTNTYLIGSGPRRMLLDTGQGVEGYTDLLSFALHDVAGADSIEAIALTHAHPDHIGGLDGVLAHCGAVPVWKMHGTKDPSGVLELRDGDEITTEGATLRAIWTPGHAADHLCFFLEQESALFTGDMVLGAGTTVIPADGDLRQYMESLHRLLEIGARVIYPAHGPAIHEPGRKIREYIAHRELRDAQILAQLTGRARTVEQIVSAIYVDVPEFLHNAAAMSVQAHLRKLVEERRVERAEEGRWIAC